MGRGCLLAVLSPTEYSLNSTDLPVLVVCLRETSVDICFAFSSISGFINERMCHRSRTVGGKREVCLSSSSWSCPVLFYTAPRNYLTYLSCLCPVLQSVMLRWEGALIVAAEHHLLPAGKSHVGWWLLLLLKSSVLLIINSLFVS